MHSMGCGGGGGSDSWSCTTKDAVACLQEAVWQSCTDGGAQGLTGYILNSKLPVCPEQDRAVFWDDVHPTCRVLTAILHTLGISSSMTRPENGQNLTCKVSSACVRVCGNKSLEWQGFRVLRIERD